MTLIVFLALPEYSARVGQEFVPLLRTLAGAAALAAVAATSFYGELRDLRWRLVAHAALVAGLVGVALVFWPGS
jgi:hypothetical protein